jgi:predicted RNA-binding Zn ribbon-like protein
MSAHRHDVPKGLETVQDFINTLEMEPDGDIEQIETPEALGAWLAERGLAPAGPIPTPAELTRAIAVREALRAELHAHGGAAPDERARRTLDDAGRRARLELRFGGGGEPRLEPAKDGVDGALGRLLATVAHAACDGSWDRLKACAAETCQWAFYDQSRNRSRVWCDMAVCGNRTKVRAYRERHGTAEA